MTLMDVRVSRRVRRTRAKCAPLPEAARRHPICASRDCAAGGAWHGRCPPADERERRLIEAVVSLAKTFREEREHLLQRVTQLEREIELLAIRLDAQER